MTHRRGAAAAGRGFRAALLGMTIAAVAGCAAIDSAFTPLFMMSADEEIAFGEKAREQIEKDLVFVTDARVVDYVLKIGATVVANAPEQAIVPVRFHVIQDDAINAFAIPGGDIYVHTGLIVAADDEAELASVMAHELGHVVYRHGAKHVSRATGVGVIQSVLLGEDAAAASELVTQVVGQGVMFHYGREDELQADSIAIPTLANAGYDPEAMVTFFQKLIDTYGDGGGGIVSLFASHPPTSQRIIDARALIRRLPAGGQRLRPVTDLRRVQAALGPRTP